MNKSVSPFLVLAFVAVLPLKLVLEVVEHALRVARGRGVDEVFHRIGQHVVLHSGTRKPAAAHPCNRKEFRLYFHPPTNFSINVFHLQRCTNLQAARRLWVPREC